MPRVRSRRPPVDGREQHQDWLSLVEIDGPFLTLPVLTRVWPTLDAVEAETMSQLRDAHAYASAKPRSWAEFIVEELLSWGVSVQREAAVVWSPAGLAWTHAEYDTTLSCDFALLRTSHSGGFDAHVAPAEVGVLGYIVEDDPRSRGAGDWPATHVDRAAQACRGLGVPLALVTSGRLWSLVWAPRGGVTTVVTFDSITWPESADRVVVRAFRSILGRDRFTATDPDEQLPALLAESLDAQEEITEQLGVQVRQAVELLVEAMGRWDAREATEGRAGLSEVPPGQVYAGAVTVLMRLMFLLFAEERGLLPGDNPVFTAGYGTAALCERLQIDAAEAGEEALEHRVGGWLQLLATAAAIHRGVDSPKLGLTCYDGSLFDPDTHPWLSRVVIDDRTVLHALRAVLFVEIKREQRRVSFRALEVEQIGYVYEGLLAFDAVRASEFVVGLTGKPGLEEEVLLTDLDRLRAAHTNLDSGVLDHAALAADLAERFKGSKIGSVKRLTTLLAPPSDADRTRVLQRLLAVTDGDRSLAERLLPFAGVIRNDLRGLPLIIPAGSLYSTASSARAVSGTHYTPATLAEELTVTALLPLVYGTPGPLDTEDENAWVQASSADILDLKVADIAMGSGAFLVAACRFLAGHLLEAWAREGDEDARDHRARLGAEGSVRADGAVAPVVVRARRAIIENCLYGVDINPMAVEMAKLSLWLVSMDPGRPFTFLDDRLLGGDSLLGIASLDQLEALHLLPDRGRELHAEALFDPTAGVRTMLADLATERRRIAEIPGTTLAQLDTKRDRLDTVERMRWRVDLIADLITAESLAHAGRGVKGLDAASVTVGAASEGVAGESADTVRVADLRERVAVALATDIVGDEPRCPFHWPLEFPEVFLRGERSGFDGIIGNPPFLGGNKITGASGTAYRNYLVHGTGRSARGSADLVAYFLLRVHDLLNGHGQSGLIATNTVAQGDTREVGLDRVVAQGVAIKSATKSRAWPSRSANLEFSQVWTSQAPVNRKVRPRLDGGAVRGITAALDPETRVTGNPARLTENTGIAFQGSIVLGMGFTVAVDRARRLISADARNAEVLFPYLNGKDLNSRPDCTASRWVIDFKDWPEERVRSYTALFAQVERDVKPERSLVKMASRRDLWWRYASRASELYRSAVGKTRVMAITRVSKVVMPVMVPTGQVFADLLVVFASDDAALLALLSSTPHYWWAIAYASSMRNDLRYTPTDVFETLARPSPSADLRALGDRLDTERRELMLARQAGLTATYNLVHDPACTDADVVNLREIHRLIDHEVFACYGWADLDPVHDHYDTRQGVRWTIDPATRTEMLDRLLELNHARYAAEQQANPQARGGGGRR